MIHTNKANMNLMQEQLALIPSVCDFIKDL